MIRQPTGDPYLWWRQAIADHATVRHDGDPQPGFYTRRAVKGGPLLPVEIRLVQVIDPQTGELTEPERIEAHELGRQRDPEKIWTYCRPITREAFDDLMDRHEVDPRMSATHAQIDVGSAPARPTKGTRYA